MSLYASIEKMKSALTRYTIVNIGAWDYGERAKKALASLPQPMTEDELISLIEDNWNSSYDVFRALKEAGCLYCKEGK